MLASIIALAVAIGFMNIMFIIYSTLASKRKLRKDRYALVPVRAKKQVQPAMVEQMPAADEDLFKDYIAEGVLLYSKDEVLSQKFSKVEHNSRVSRSVSAPAPARFSMADFR